MLEKTDNMWVMGLLVMVVVLVLLYLMYTFLGGFLLP